MSATALGAALILRPCDLEKLFCFHSVRLGVLRLFDAQRRSGFSEEWRK